MYVGPCRLWLATMAMAFLTGLVVGAYRVPSLESIPVGLNHVMAGHNQHLFSEQPLPTLICSIVRMLVQLTCSVV